MLFELATKLSKACLNQGMNNIAKRMTWKSSVITRLKPEAG